jgi:DNA polymerase-3 subunit epsilon
MRQIILDTETTGLSTAERHRIIEVGCIELINRRFTGNHFHQYINPAREIDSGALNVHGISNEFLADKPLFHEIAESLLDYLSGAELIIHNADFDVGFLNYEFSLLNKNFKQIQHYCQIVDTLKLARQKHPGQRNSLDALCKRYEVDNSGRTLHGALLDAELLADVYLAMTGGQVSLFTDERNQAGSQNKIANAAIQPVQRAFSVPVIAADEKELAAHLAFLNTIKQQSAGTCLWEPAITENVGD